MIVPLGDFGDLAVCGIDEKLPKMGPVKEDILSILKRFYRISSGEIIVSADVESAKGTKVTG